jgi:RHS repeat-associated protein
MSISGKTKYDAFARKIEQFHPYYETKQLISNIAINNDFTTNISNRSSYDIINRPVLITDADNSNTMITYQIENDNLGNLSFETHTEIEQNTSQNLNKFIYEDIRNRQTAVKDVGPDGDIWTSFTYNSIGELLSFKDDADIQTTYTYDKMGRKLSVENTDFGTTRFEYDNASNLIKLRTANLSGSLSSGFIEYQYDINRISNIIFPTVSGNENISNVTYGYGNSGNNTGKLIFQEDATGEQYFHYGNMGELTRIRRTIVAPNMPDKSFGTQFTYDSWNRLTSMVYPDNEELSYQYDNGGNLIKITGTVYNGDYDYVKRVDYDYYEQKTYIEYGNGTKNQYSYTPTLRRLDVLNVLNNNNSQLINNTYSYDKVGNITGLRNGASVSDNGLLGEFRHVYSYDILNRLSSASGQFFGQENVPSNDFSSDYNLNMTYNNTHDIIVKEQSHNKNGAVYQPNTYNSNYHYIPNTHKLEYVRDEITGNNKLFNYDLNGNTIYYKNTATDDTRRMYWDESNRLRVVELKKSMQHYIYDANGERTLKANTSSEQIYNNGQLINNAITINSYTMYPSAYLVLDNDEYTKHYFLGSMRIATQLGSGSVSFDARRGKKMTKFDKLRNLQKLDLQHYLGKSKLKSIKFKSPKKEVVKPNKSSDKKGTKAPDVVFFYHPDHLSTATLITDSHANSYQFFLNLPFGEEMASQHSLTADFDTRYKFNGKELDTETDWYYYGARYYDPSVSRWLSVDPLASEFPNESPYVYAGNSPIVYVDPDGRFKISIHKRILMNAFKASGISTGFLGMFQADAKLGVSVEADILGFASDYHFDGRQNFKEVQSTWSSLNNSISSKIDDLGSFNRKYGGDDAVIFGRMLHTVQDFYSHSNYVELYVDYYKSINDGVMPTSIPIYDDGIKIEGFNNILEGNLRTGDFDIVDNEITNPNGKKAQESTSHNKMNKDKADTPLGKLAEKVATKHTTVILNKLNDKK